MVFYCLYRIEWSYRYGMFVDIVSIATIIFMNISLFLLLTYIVI